MGALYQITFPNGKAYIGITAGTVNERMAEHRYNAASGRGNSAVHRALRKYEAAEARTLLIADDWSYLCQMERRAIEVYGTFGPGGYNMTRGGDGALGYKHTPESLAIMGAVHKGLRPRLGIPHTPEARAKMSAARKGRPLSPSHRANVIAALKGNRYLVGRKQSDEHRKAIKFGILTSGKPKKNSKSGVRGVAWCSRTGKWRAHITIDGKMRDLGRFSDLALAKASREAALSAFISGGQP